LPKSQTTASMISPSPLRRTSQLSLTKSQSQKLEFSKCHWLRSVRTFVHSQLFSSPQIFVCCQTWKLFKADVSAQIYNTKGLWCAACPLRKQVTEDGMCVFAPRYCLSSHDMRASPSEYINNFSSSSHFFFSYNLSNPIFSKR
jgi:hypothetical protein